MKILFQIECFKLKGDIPCVSCGLINEEANIDAEGSALMIHDNFNSISII